jgi:hypothetical protein
VPEHGGIERSVVMKKTRVLVAAGLAAAAIVAATAAASGDSDTPITGTELERASAAALAYTGGGRVTGTEVGDEESLYEVEVTLADGTQVDVQLDAQFVVVGTEADGHDDEGEQDD